MLLFNMLLSNAKIAHWRIHLILASALLFSGCGHNVNVPQDMPYINHTAKLPEDSFICESAGLLPGHVLDLKTLEKDFNVCSRSVLAGTFSAEELHKDPEKYQAWEYNVLEKARVLGFVPKGTLFVINEIYEPQIMSDAAPYVMLTVLNGRFKGMTLKALSGLTNPDIKQLLIPSIKPPVTPDDKQLLINSDGKWRELSRPL